jgi:hypothetical protein
MMQERMVKTRAIANQDTHEVRTVYHQSGSNFKVGLCPRGAATPKHGRQTIRLTSLFGHGVLVESPVRPWIVVVWFAPGSISDGDPASYAGTVPVLRRPPLPSALNAPLCWLALERMFPAIAAFDAPLAHRGLPSAFYCPVSSTPPQRVPTSTVQYSGGGDGARRIAGRAAFGQWQSIIGPARGRIACRTLSVARFAPFW